MCDRAKWQIWFHIATHMDFSIFLLFLSFVDTCIQKFWIVKGRLTNLAEKINVYFQVCSPVSRPSIQSSTGKLRQGIRWGLYSLMQFNVITLYFICLKCCCKSSWTFLQSLTASLCRRSWWYLWPLNDFASKRFIGESSFQEEDYNFCYARQQVLYVAIQKQTLISLILLSVWAPPCFEGGHGSAAEHFYSQLLLYGRVPGDTHDH